MLKNPDETGVTDKARETINYIYGNQSLLINEITRKILVVFWLT